MSGVLRYGDSWKGRAFSRSVEPDWVIELGWIKLTVWDIILLGHMVANMMLIWSFQE